MIEFFTKGIVLDKMAADNNDGLFVIFTEKLGKIYGQATSSRKITSKLNSHLEPSSFSALRLVQKNSGNVFRIIDALIENKRLDIECIKMLHFIKETTPFLQSDFVLFKFLKETVLENKPFDNWPKKVLKILGFDPDYAACDHCGFRPVAYFINQDIIFLCRQCANLNSCPPEKLIKV